MDPLGNPKQYDTVNNFIIITWTAEIDLRLNIFRGTLYVSRPSVRLNE